MIMIASVMSPQWLIGYPRKPGLLTLTDLDNKTVSDDEDSFQPTIGIINRCTRLHKFREILKRENCATYVTSVDMPDSQFPDAWKASLAFFSVGCIILVFTMGTSVLSLCIQSMCGKSIFSVSGFIQSIAGGYQPNTEMYSYIYYTNLEILGQSAQFRMKPRMYVGRSIMYEKSEFC